jgi:hypothetical protein
LIGELRGCDGAAGVPWNGLSGRLMSGIKLLRRELFWRLVDETRLEVDEGETVCGVCIVLHAELRACAGLEMLLLKRCKTAKLLFVLEDQALDSARLALASYMKVLYAKGRIYWIGEKREKETLRLSDDAMLEAAHWKENQG